MMNYIFKSYKKGAEAIVYSFPGIMRGTAASAGQDSKMAAILGECVRLYTYSKYSLVSGNHVLPVLDIVVYDLQEPVGLFSDAAHYQFKSRIWHVAGELARVDGAHRVVGPAVSVAVNGDLHRQPAVEGDRN
ncbi:hypothetical protein HG530_015710 [Fusarium avenaceum]|nr:hypothetical protein HG530_015710 [Fusarium avenaceum]